MTKRVEYRVPLCPICVTWTCDICLHSMNLVDGRLSRRCTNCDWPEGTKVPVRHHDLDKYEEHETAFRTGEKVHPVDSEKIRDTIALIEILRPLVHKYDRMADLSGRQETDSFEWNATCNTGNETLMKIDSTVRSWVLKHGEEPQS